MAKDHPLNEFYGDIFGTYDRINRIFTFGRDRSWRAKAVDVCLASDPSSVLDLCTGTGDYILEVARRTGHGILLTGFDFSREMLQVAREKARKQGEKDPAAPIRFLEGDAAEMPFGEGEFDAVGITFGIRNLVYENSHAEKHLSEIYRVLSPGGRLIVLESARPSNPVWRPFNAFYLRFILPYLGGLISGNLGAYRYLARSSRNYYSIAEMCSILSRAGFTCVQTRALFLGSVMLVVAEKK
jgi:demethylmenaquinone methyltransferase/2-methoxy-6-polyprenyl-1,4-benzoquinol methylase